jgi:hypothetical protein
MSTGSTFCEMWLKNILALVMTFSISMRFFICMSFFNWYEVFIYVGFPFSRSMRAKYAHEALFDETIHHTNISLQCRAKFTSSLYNFESCLFQVFMSCVIYKVHTPFDTSAPLKVTSTLPFDQEAHHMHLLYSQRADHMISKKV